MGGNLLDNIESVYCDYDYDYDYDYDFLLHSLILPASSYFRKERELRLKSDQTVLKSGSAIALLCEAQGDSVKSQGCGGRGL